MCTCPIHLRHQRRSPYRNLIIMSKPYPPIHIQELLESIGFYSSGFCAGHCEHAPLRESNPELNKAIESWHDKYYSSPTLPARHQAIDVSDYLTGEPVADWRAIAFDLVNTVQTFDPEAWLMESGTELPKFLMRQVKWLEDTVVPALNRFYDVLESYSDDSESADPF